MFFSTFAHRLRQLHGRKVRMEAVGVIVNKIGDTITIEKKEGEEESNTTSTAVGTTPTPDEIHHEDEIEDMSENESEGTQPEEVCFTIRILYSSFVSYLTLEHNQNLFRRKTRIYPVRNWVKSWTSY